MSKDVEELKKDNERLANRVKMLEQPFNIENELIVSIDVGNEIEDVGSVRVIRVNDSEFVNGGLYMSLISKHFNEIHESIVTKMIANRMSNAIEEAKNNGTATKNMLDSLKEWNNMLGIEEEKNQ
jgi:hypothetical protein